VITVCGPGQVPEDPSPLVVAALRHVNQRSGGVGRLLRANPAETLRRALRRPGCASSIDRQVLMAVAGNLRSWRAVLTRPMPGGLRAAARPGRRSQLAPPDKRLLVPLRHEDGVTVRLPAGGTGCPGRRRRRRPARSDRYRCPVSTRGPGVPPGPAAAGNRRTPGRTRSRSRAPCRNGPTTSNR
jgi:hypothetical protein